MRIYPLSAIVDQEKMKQALIGTLNVEKVIKTVEKGLIDVSSIVVKTECNSITFGIEKQVSFEKGVGYLLSGELNGASIVSAVRDELFHDPGIIIKND